MKQPRADARTGFALAGAAAAVGLAAGLAATAGARGIAKVAEPLAGDWFAIMKTEHLVVLELFERLEGTAPSAKARRLALLEKIRQALTRHAVQEENVLYPALRIAGLDIPAVQLAAEHADVRTTLYELEDLAADHPSWKGRVRSVRGELEAHMVQEEEEIFPELRRLLTPDQNERLTARMLREGRRVC